MAPAKQGFFQRLIAFFKPSPPSSGKGSSSKRADQTVAGNSRKPERVEVTSPKLYVGNLSYNATEGDLTDLFRGVGQVRSAEIASDKYNDRSKGFGFVMMATIDEAKRAVVELHDKEFMGRRLVVTGSKSGDREPNYRG